MSLDHMKACYFLLVIILPLTVGAQNTNSQKLQEEPPFDLKELQEKRINELKPKAEEGDAAAQYELGQMLVFDATSWPPTPVEPKPEGLKWLRKAAEQGNIHAQADLGSWLMNSHPSDTNTEAIKWLRAAADQGAVRAQFELGNCYELGEVVATNYSEAAKLFRKAGEQGHGFSQARLAGLYSAGKGVPRDLKEAYVWKFISNVCGASSQDIPTPLDTESASLQQKDEEKLTGSELADAQKEAVRRLVEIAKRVNATESAE